MKLVLAEKPSVAQSLAKVLGANKRCDGYLEGNGYVVSWCVGHLVELSQPEAYNETYAKWRLEDLPILPTAWMYQVSASTKKQFGILKDLMKREDVKSLVCATDEEQSYFRRIYDRLIAEVQEQHDKTVAPIIAYNQKKIENWVNVQQEQLHVQLTDVQNEVEKYILAEMQATDTLEKQDIRKKAAEAKKKMDKLQRNLPKRRQEIQDEAQAEIDRFNQAQKINPVLMVNIVLKF